MPVTSGLATTRTGASSAESNGSTATLGQPGALVAAALSPGVGVVATPKHSSALVAAASCSAGTMTWKASGAEVRLAAERIAPGSA